MDIVQYFFRETGPYQQTLIIFHSNHDTIQNHNTAYDKVAFATAAAPVTAAPAALATMAPVAAVLIATTPKG